MASNPLSNYKFGVMVLSGQYGTVDQLSLISPGNIPQPVVTIGTYPNDCKWLYYDIDYPQMSKTLAIAGLTNSF